LFLTESENKSVVYFTQSAGELSITGGGPRGGTPPQLSAARLRDYLQRNNLEVRPLTLDPKDPKVPADAAGLIVAEPRQPLDPAHVEAITKYMHDPRPGGKKGKLIVLAGATLGPKNEILRTGLEGLLREFTVELEPKILLHPMIQGLDLEPDE